MENRWPDTDFLAVLLLNMSMKKIYRVVFDEKSQVETEFSQPCRTNVMWTIHTIPSGCGVGDREQRVQVQAVECGQQELPQDHDRTYVWGANQPARTDQPHPCRWTIATDRICGLRYGRQGGWIGEFGGVGGAGVGVQTRFCWPQLGRNSEFLSGLRGKSVTITPMPRQAIA